MTDAMVIILMIPHSRLTATLRFRAGPDSNRIVGTRQNHSPDGCEGDGHPHQILDGTLALVAVEQFVSEERVTGHHRIFDITARAFRQTGKPRLHGIAIEGNGEIVVLAMIAIAIPVSPDGLATTEDVADETVVVARFLVGSLGAVQRAGIHHHHSHSSLFTSA